MTNFKLCNKCWQTKWLPPLSQGSCCKRMDGKWQGCSYYERPPACKKTKLAKELIFLASWLMRRYRQGQTGRVFSTSGRVGFGYWKNILGRVGYRVFVSNTKSTGYYRVLKSWLGIRRVSPLYPILSNIYYLIWLIWSIKHVFGRHIYVIVVQCGRSWQSFGDRRKSHKPLESAHLQNFATKMPYL